VKNFPAQNPSSPHTRADRDIQQGRGLPRPYNPRAKFVFAQRPNIRIIINACGRGEFFLQSIAQWKVFPSWDMMRENHNAASRVDRSAKADTDRAGLASVEQSPGEIKHGGLIVSRSMIGGSENALESKPFARAGSSYRGGKLCAAVIESKEDFRHINHRGHAAQKA
jgi:hypothetical protein